MSDFKDGSVFPVSADEVKSYCIDHGIGMLDEHAGVDNWFRCLIKVCRLRNMHGAFGRPDEGFKELDKGKLYSHEYATLKPLIEAEAFPRSAKIKTNWPDKPAIIVQQTLSSGELYVVDGVTRTFHALYHGDQWLDAFVVTLDQERDVIN